MRRRRGSGCSDPTTADPATRPPTQTEGARRKPGTNPPRTGRPRGAKSKREGERIETTRIAATLDGYEAALNAGNGAKLCRLFEDGALDDLELPVDRASCAGSLSASIGYRDPRGFPVFESVTLLDNFTTAFDRDTVRVTVATVTEFADRTEASIEDDLMYLRRSGDRWLLRQPSITLYRAIGSGDPPPRALSPP